MEATHHHNDHAEAEHHDDHGHNDHGHNDHGHNDHGHDAHGAHANAGGAHPDENWFDDEYIHHWLHEQEKRADVRHRQFVIIRSVVPKTPDQEFRYVNLGAGPGNLDEVLLEQFPAARATLVDGSMAMLAEARKRLERFEDRIELVQADLSTPDWAGAVSGPFDLAVSSIALHNLREPRRLREMYGETFRLLGHGGLFLNLDYVRMARPSLSPLAAWAARDTEAKLMASRGGPNVPGTVDEQLGWLTSGGFACADCLWKEMGVALMVGVRDHLHLPEGEAHDHAEHAAEHAH